jgi:O-antigen ligase
MNILPTYVGLFLLYIVLSLVPPERKDYIVLLCAMVIGSVAASAYGVVVFHAQSVADAQALADNLGRLSVHIGDNTIDPNAYSDAILLPFCILLMWGLRSNYFLYKLAAIAGLGTMLAAVYVSASRGAILAIGAALLYLIVRSRYRIQLLVAAVVPAVVGLSASSSLLDRFADTQRTGGAGRLGIWSVGMEAFKQHWLTGAGVGNYRALYDTFFIHVYQAYSGGWSRPAHNLIVQVMVELGVIGLALVLAFWFSNLFSLRHIRPGDEWYDFRIALEAATIGLFIAALSVDLIWFKLTWLLFGSVAQLRALTIGARAPARARRAVMSDIEWGVRNVRPELQPRRTG